MAGALVAGAASAAPLRSFGVGPDGYGTEMLEPNDDGFSGPLPLPFTINFFGTAYSQFYLNNNGNISFGEGVSSYTPLPFGTSPTEGGNSTPMIAPFWADVDTRGDGGGSVYTYSPNADQLTVTWHDVGYYSQHSDLTNDFQLTLINQHDGDFDIEFRYNRLEWTTGDASNGEGGLGGTPAQAGYDDGGGVNFLTLPGSFTEDVLALTADSNVGEAGRWLFGVRGGGLGDGSVEHPYLPESQGPNGEFNFEFGVADNQFVFIDPPVSVGYIYEVLSGPNILAAIFPVLPGQGDYSIYDLAGNLLLGTATGGNPFFFAPGGVNGFQVLGISAGLGLNPDNSMAFQAGLSFNVSGGLTTINLSQTPITFDTGVVPEPSTWAMLILGFGAVGSMMRRRRAAVAFG
jgi:hypothetical protein